jgi:hypothetical protein
MLSPISHELGQNKLYNESYERISIEWCRQNKVRVPEP